MENLVNYFENIPSLHRSLILVGGIAIFWMIESAVPLFKFSYKKWNHALLNFFFTITTITVNFLLAFFLFLTSEWTIENQFGLLHWLPDMPLWVSMILGLMILDLIGAYFAHWIQHRNKLMWKFHLVHHTDTFVDTTSANRHHPGESVIRFLLTTLAVLISGVPIWMVFLYQSLSVIFSQFNHANLNLPERVDRIISWVIVSPNMHKVHHHYVLPYTDTNFGNIFSIWDRIFGTFSYLPKDEIIYGVDTHMEAAEHSDLANLIKMPFQKYRPPTTGESVKERDLKV